MCTIKTCETLIQELDQAKQTLGCLNDNIRRLIGREPKESILRGDRKRQQSGGVRSHNGTKPKTEGSPLKVKHRYSDSKSVFSRLSATSPRSKNRESMEEIKPRINSRVIRELPTRQEIVAAQGTDAQSRARNRRIFGSLLGTLHKFCQEESRLKQREEKKAKIEKKLEEQETQEKEIVRKERETLLIDRKRTQMKVLSLECKLNRLRDFEVWEKNKLCLNKFLVTQTKPNIFFLPKNFDKQSEKLLKGNKKEIKTAIANKRINLLHDFLEIDKRFSVKDGIEDVMHQNNLNETQCFEFNANNQQNSIDSCILSSIVAKKKAKRPDL